MSLCHFVALLPRWHLRRWGFFSGSENSENGGACGQRADTDSATHRQKTSALALLNGGVEWVQTRWPISQRFRFRFRFRRESGECPSHLYRLCIAHSAAMSKLKPCPLIFARFVTPAHSAGPNCAPNRVTAAYSARMVLCGVRLSKRHPTDGVSIPFPYAREGRGSSGAPLVRF